MKPEDDKEKKDEEGADDKSKVKSGEVKTRGSQDTRMPSQKPLEHDSKSKVNQMERTQNGSSKTKKVETTEKTDNTQISQASVVGEKWIIDDFYFFFTFTDSFL